MSSDVKYHEVGEANAGQRLDNFLIAHLKGVPRSHIYRLLRRGEVRVNRRRAKPDQRLEVGDSVRVPPVRLREKGAPSTLSVQRREQLEQAILYEDDALMVVDKPTGLAVHGGSGIRSGLIELLRLMRPEQRLELVHRLDRETSGCLLVAKTRSALLELHRQLREGEVEKQYTALCSGRWPAAIRTVDAPLQKNRSLEGERRVVTSESGKASVTHFRVLQRFREATLLRVSLDTGRTHQIRVHAQLVGCPLAADERYADRDSNRRFRQLGLNRLFLHASRVQFIHPVRSTTQEVESPLPGDLAVVLEKLEQS